MWEFVVFPCLGMLSPLQAWVKSVGLWVLSEDIALVWRRGQRSHLSTVFSSWSKPDTKQMDLLSALPACSCEAVGGELNQWVIQQPDRSLEIKRASKGVHLPPTCMCLMGGWVHTSVPLCWWKVEANDPSILWTLHPNPDPLLVIWFKVSKARSHHHLHWRRSHWWVTPLGMSVRVLPDRFD